jgi:hypothetical protein
MLLCPFGAHGASTAMAEADQALDGFRRDDVRQTEQVGAVRGRVVIFIHGEKMGPMVVVFG